MNIVVPVIVILIIVAQAYFFSINIRRMNVYGSVFDEKDSWKVSKNSQNFVDGISGEGNSVFMSIKESINEYLSNNSGSVIDFQLLKDAVDRHCDSVENDVNTLTPIPLYCGLAGTMLGVIIGLASLIFTGSIKSLLTSGTANFDSAANGVNDLLFGVAWAMFASICGILLTTISSLIFKGKKIKGESGKSSFIAWLQARLLPELPSDTSDALNRLVKNLNRFNSTFADNTSHLRGALSEVNESYRIQGNIIQAVHDMDVMKMAQANVKVLEELKECTDKLEQFNQYLNDIHGYTDAIHTFTTQFEQEADRLHVLEDIKHFFEKHKGIMAKDVADSDNALRQALQTVKEAANANTIELNKTLTEQAEAFKQIIKDERDSFAAISSEIAENFQKELGKMPMLQQRFTEISAIPSKLDSLIAKMETSNSKLAASVAGSMEKVVQKLVSSAKDLKSSSLDSVSDVETSSNNESFSKWMRWTIVASAVVMAIACLANAVNNICFSPKNTVVVPDTTVQDNWFDTVSVSHQAVDSIAVDSINAPYQNSKRQSASIEKTENRKSKTDKQVKNSSSR